jgi:hypothetical protein
MRSDRQQHWVAKTFGPRYGISGLGKGPIEQRRHHERYSDPVEDSHHRGVVTGAFGNAEGFVGQSLAVLKSAAIGELRTKRREHERPLWADARQSIESHLEYRDPLGVNSANSANESPIVGQASGYEPIGIAEVGRPSGGFEKRLAKRRVTRLALSGAQPDGQI